MPILVTGSFAFDTILELEDTFEKRLCPNQIDISNVCFRAQKMHKKMGGCAGNIAYNLHLLDEKPTLMGTVGEDFEVYRKKLDDLGLDHTHVKTIKDTYTAQAFLITDRNKKQIIIFHPGAMDHAHGNKIAQANNITLGIVAPDGFTAMIQHAEQFYNAGIPFFFDPGQGLPMFNGEELKLFIEQANFACFNEDEFKMMQDKTTWSLKTIANKVEALIVTYGSKGASIYAEGRCIDINTIKVFEENDPTGCGDAFRAGLLYGVTHGWDWLPTGQLASLLGGIKIEQHGAQNHTPNKATLMARYRENFHSDIQL